MMVKITFRQNSPIFVRITHRTSPDDTYKMQEFKIIPGTTVGTTDGMTIYTNSELIEKRVDVYLDGVLLYPGLTDRQSYTLNVSAGTLTFNNPIYATQTIIIHAE